MMIKSSVEKSLIIILSLPSCSVIQAGGEEERELHIAQLRSAAIRGSFLSNVRTKS